MLALHYIAWCKIHSIGAYFTHVCLQCSTLKYWSLSDTEWLIMWMLKTLYWK